MFDYDTLEEDFLNSPVAWDDESIDLNNTMMMGLSLWNEKMYRDKAITADKLVQREDIAYDYFARPELRETLKQVFPSEERMAWKTKMKDAPEVGGILRDGFDNILSAVDAGLPLEQIDQIKVDTYARYYAEKYGIPLADITRGSFTYNGHEYKIASLKDGMKIKEVDGHPLETKYS